MKAPPKLLISRNFSPRIETRAEQLPFVVDRVQRMLDELPGVEPGTSRIRVDDVSNAAFNMELWAYIKTGDWAQFTGIRQEVILKITEIVEASGLTQNRDSDSLRLAGEARAIRRNLH